VAHFGTREPQRTSRFGRLPRCEHGLPLYYGWLLSSSRLRQGEHGRGLPANLPLGENFRFMSIASARPGLAAGSTSTRPSGYRPAYPAITSHRGRDAGGGSELYCPGPQIVLEARSMAHEQ
jgi:hypothetical protein